MVLARDLMIVALGVAAVVAARRSVAAIPTPIDPTIALPELPGSGFLPAPDQPGRGFAADETGEPGLTPDAESVPVQSQGAAADLDWRTVQHWRLDELRGQEHDISAVLVRALDDFRERLGSPVMISPARGALARYALPRTSQHYAVGRLCTAADVMPLDATLEAAYAAAVATPTIGGVGIYPRWRPYPGLHLDVRDRHADGSLAEWMGLPDADRGQVYAALDWGRVS